MLHSTVLRISAAMAVALTAGAVVVATASSAPATQGEPVIAGEQNTATDWTGILNSSPNGVGFAGQGDTTGVLGMGVYGIGYNGVYGQSPTPNGGNGVFGQSNSATASGVYGQNDSTGFGVAGRATDGTGVLADSTNGTALRVVGKAEFSRSGIATVTAGNSKVTVTGVAMTSASLVVATIQGNVAGTWVRGVTKNVTNGSFTIFLNKAATADTKVGWFVVN